jgi:hypothetical protein
MESRELAQEEERVLREDGTIKVQVYEPRHSIGHNWEVKLAVIMGTQKTKSSGRMFGPRDEQHPV